MKYLPINLDVRDRPCLVVGGGEVGERKVRGLLECQARVRLVSRELTPGLKALVEAGRVELLGPEYTRAHLEGVGLVFAATNEAEVNARVSREARERGLEVNVADQPQLCTFILPASLRRGDLTLSVCTGGQSPALAASLRRRLEQSFGPEYALFVELLGLIRTRVLAEGRPPAENHELFRRLVDSDLLETLARDDLAAAESRLQDILGPEYTFARLGFRPPQETSP